MLILRQDLFEENHWSPFMVEWSELLEIAKLAQAKNFTAAIKYGFIAPWCGSYADCYDQFACTFTQALYAFGGDLWNTDTYAIDGVFDSPQNAEAMQMCKDLVDTCDEDCKDIQLSSVVDAICDGSALMGLAWVSQGPDFLSPSCAMRDKLTFVNPPKGDQSKSLIGGQGLGINPDSTELAAALELFKWFLTLETQRQWGNAGGLTTHASIMQSVAFVSSAPYIALYVANFAYTSDFWRLPQYNELMKLYMAHAHQGITGEVSPETALRQTSQLEQNVINTYYPCGPGPCQGESDTGFPVWAAIVIGTVGGSALLILLILIVVGVVIAVLFVKLREKFYREGVQAQRMRTFGGRARN
eukprot:TRINITY_DN2171_c0_g2_i4.p1 TRINITY_DN2171_c0_g2~~TRINITY_DN2171_c0_g2_i4.p1  ORF type:complete len:357 (+),score=46.29 TRINITY_DN2171_c0_g2_i4:346-1416(+)